MPALTSLPPFPATRADAEFMASLYAARARVPKDVSEEYGRRFGQRFEAKFSTPATTKPADAKRLYGEWLRSGKVV